MCQQSGPSVSGDARKEYLHVSHCDEGFRQTLAVAAVSSDEHEVDSHERMGTAERDA
jgi:hypothetical protein